MRLSDVATLVSGAENSKLAGWMNSTPALLINVQRQPAANVVDVVDSIKKLLPALQASLPAGVELAVLTDRTTTIRASIRDVQFELVLAVALVVLVIFLFLRNVPATLIPALSVPLSLIGTFAVMYLAHFSLNNLSLMALTIATGFVVDDAIVMIENIARFLEQGDSPLQAALKGSKQIGFTIISLTVSLVAVLIPLLFMQDVVGRLFREFAVTLAVTILISARRVADAGADDVRQAAARAWQARHAQRHLDARRLRRCTGRCRAWFRRIVGWYARSLTWVLDHQRLTLAVAVGTLLLTALLYVLIPKGFFPDPGYRSDPGCFRGKPIGVLCRNGRSPTGARRGDTQGSGRAEPVLVHRRGWQQRHAQQRAFSHQPASPAANAATRRPRSRGASRPRPRTYRASRCTCSRCRT